jgi:hypothetical protein
MKNLSFVNGQWLFGRARDLAADMPTRSVLGKQDPYGKQK